MKISSPTYGLGDTLILTAVCKYFPKQFIVQLPPEKSHYSILFEHLADVEICEKDKMTPFLGIGQGHFATRRLRTFFGDAADGLDNRPLVLYSDKESEIWASNFLKDKKNPCIMVKNCSKYWSETRSIPDDLFPVIVETIKKTHTPIVCQSSANYTKTEEIEFIDLDLKKYICLLRQTGFYCGANTGDEHLASAVGCRTVVYQPKDSDKFNSLEWNYFHPNSVYLNW